jgi:hypothetical protein
MSQPPHAGWKSTFSQLFHTALQKYRQGHQKAPGLLDPNATSFLSSIGHTEQEFFDFIEDYAKSGEPTPETALDIASVRRDYFLREQKALPSPHRISIDDLPSKDATVEGIPWLPRLIPKALAKLRGEMPPELMYACGGDRKFFHAHHINPADFLRKTWTSNGNQTEIIAWIKAKSK